jgi:hypothetical protein
MFVLILSESLQKYHIYCFNANSLKWNRIEWLQFPVNHAFVFDGSLTEVDNNNLFNLGRP